MLKLSFPLLAIAAFSSIAKAQTATLTCDFYTHTVSCNLTDITSANQPIVLTGEPVTYVNETINQFYFQNHSIMKFVPTGIFKFFPKLTFFDIQFAQMTTLVTDAFTNCDQFQKIVIVDNDIQSVPAAFAQSCRRTNIIILGLNNISSIHVDAFKGLKMLQLLDMSGNNITCIPSGLFRHSLAISSINFAGNKITAFDPKTFTYLPPLNRMFFMQNPIKYLHNLDFTRSGMVEGILFHISSDSLVAVDPEFISNTALNCCGPRSFTIHIMSQTPLNESTSCVLNNIKSYSYNYGKRPNEYRPNNDYFASYMPYSSSNYPNSYNTFIIRPFINYVYSDNSAFQNILLEPCYANWTSEIANLKLPCANVSYSNNKLPCCCNSNSFETTTTTSDPSTTAKTETTKIGITTKCATKTKKPKKGNGKSKSSSE